MKSLLDLKKIKILKIVGWILLVILAALIGFSAGQGSTKTKTQEKPKQKTTVASSSFNVKQKDVEEFLLNYYTKKDLGENRKRYKEYMTEGMYSQEVAKENEPQNQTYKGFVVDFEYQGSEIYIDEKNHQVLAQVRYTNTLLDEKKNYDSAVKDVQNETVLKLSYSEDNEKFKINKIETMALMELPSSTGIASQSETSHPEEETTTTASSSSSN
ncbi:hypothetical protein O3620_01020 [Streptococcus sp. 27098_8_134]|uniref:hypothetical protein n=1 Tax=Streptococcus sp. 27098_8_134 TaxID=3003644 RepID=UPI00352C5204